MITFRASAPYERLNPTQPFAHELVGIGKNREGRPAFVFKGWIVQQRQLINQMIEAGTQVVGDIANQKTPFQRWFLNVDASDEQLPFFIVVNLKRVTSFGRNPTFDTGLEIAQVVLGLRNLRANTV